MTTPQFKKIQVARTALLLEQPFFGTLALHLQIVELDKSQCSTMCTDGRILGYNPEFVDSLSKDELIGVLAHEVMHCACGHPWRKDSREHMRFNIACDLAINPIIQEAGLTLPKSALIEDQFKEKSAEWIYDRVKVTKQKQSASQMGQVSNAGSMGQGDPEQGEGQSGEGSAQGEGMSEADWKQATTQSLQQAKMRGKLPANIARLMDKLLEPKVDWRSLLRKYVQEIVKADYSWKMPNRRYMTSGMYLPSLHSEACGKIAVAVDTSGSIDSVLLNQFASEVQAIVSEMNPISVDIVWCDAKVHRVDTFASGEPLVFNPVGGGGTDFAPVFNQYESNAELDVPAVLIYLTDLYGSFPKSEPEFPTIWCVTGKGDKEAPFGDTVPMD